ncbi:MAG: DUF5666 domain-containing protein [Acidobacteriota bacterium]
MRIFAGALVAAALLAGQSGPEGTTVRGTLVDWDAGPSGDLSVRLQNNHVVCFRFDRATAVERDGVRASLPDLRKGDMVEIAAGRGPNARLPRARSLRVVAMRRDAPPRAARPAAVFSALDDLYPRGDLALAGVVRSLSPGRMVLRTRTAGDTEIVLRDDTRYFGGGRESAYSGLAVNARVFVRAGRDLDGRVEAYQVTWGAILRTPDANRVY